MSSATCSPEELLRQVKEIRQQGLDHKRRMEQLAAERRELLEQLVTSGVSRARIARELGVSRQAVQQMLAR